MPKFILTWYLFEDKNHLYWYIKMITHKLNHLSCYCTRSFCLWFRDLLIVSEKGGSGSRIKRNTVKPHIQACRQVWTVLQLSFFQARSSLSYVQLHLILTACSTLVHQNFSYNWILPSYEIWVNSWKNVYNNFVHNGLWFAVNFSVLSPIIYAPRMALMDLLVNFQN